MNFTLFYYNLRLASRRNDYGYDAIDLYDAQRGAIQNQSFNVYSLQAYIDKIDSSQYTSREQIIRFLDAATDNPIWMLYGLLFLGCICGYLILCQRLRTERRRFDPRMRQVRIFDRPEGPAIGGPFELVNTNGITMRDTDFRGKWMFIYFGFSNCPDVCPNEMQKLTRMITQLDRKIGKDVWQPIFITVDPGRDNPKQLKEYLSDFHPRIIGLTGSQEAIERVAHAYRVYFSISNEYPSSTDYLVDHSIIMYLMNPEGKFVDYTTKDFNWHEMLAKVFRRMTEHDSEIHKRAKALTSKQKQKLMGVPTANELQVHSTYTLVTPEGRP